MARKEYTNTNPITNDADLENVNFFNLVEKYKKQVINVAADTLIETHYFPIKKKTYTKNTEYINGKIMINLLSCYWAVIIQYCNFKYIMDKLGYSEYADYTINNEDVKYNVMLNTSHLVNETCTEIYDNAIKTLFSNKSLVNWDITECYRLKSYLDITFVMNKINFDWKSLLFVDNENKLFMKVYTYHTKSKNKQSSKLITYDGMYKLPISEYHREMLTRYFITDHKACNKFIGDLLSPYIPRKDYNVLGEIVGYQYLFDCIRQYKCRNKLNPLNESELNLFKIEFKEYIETCTGIWGNQTEAIKYINEHRSEFCDSSVSDNFEENKNKEIITENVLTSMSQDFTIAIEDTTESELEPIETISYFNPKKYKTDQEFWEALNKSIVEKPKEVKEELENIEFFKKLSES